jgi:hypothetical protein
VNNLQTVRSYDGSKRFKNIVVVVDVTNKIETDRSIKVEIKIKSKSKIENYYYESNRNWCYLFECTTICGVERLIPDTG